jgi:hypothetical protein
VNLAADPQVDNDRTVLRISLALMMVLTVMALVVATRYRQMYLVVPDNIGYLQASHQLAQGQGLAFVDPHNRFDARYYTLHTFKVFRPGEPNRYLDYPPGLPLLAALLEALVQNQDAVHIAVPIMAALLVASTSALGILCLGPWAGLWAGLILVATPMFLQFSTSLWSEIPGAALIYAGCTLHIAGAKLWIGDSRKAVSWSLLGGLVIGTSFFVRVANLSILPVLGLMVLIAAHRGSGSRARAYALGGAILVSLAAVLAFNTVYYGGPLTTAYTPKHGWYTEPAFSLSYAFGDSFVDGPSVPAIGRVLLEEFGWLLPLALVGVATYCRRTSVLLLGLFACLVMPYTVYAFSPQGVNGRFLIPAWPVVCLLIGKGIVFLLSKFQRKIWRLGIGGVLIIALVYDLPSQFGELAERNQASQREVARVVSLATAMEPGAVVMSYVSNDLFAVYGERSVLNYRHMVPYDPASGQYMYSEFAPRLVKEVNYLLDQGIPTYYIYDRDPPLLDSYRILAEHFSLTSVGDADIVWQVARR